VEPSQDDFGRNGPLEHELRIFPAGPDEIVRNRNNCTDDNTQDAHIHDLKSQTAKQTRQQFFCLQWQSCIAHKTQHHQSIASGFTLLQRICAVMGMDLDRNKTAPGVRAVLNFHKVSIELSQLFPKKDITIQ